ncbi:hypothetical protein CFE53_06125 [Methanofervidicoccus sp. A16]|uniref:hypothetical protein n=1 Tax=Methanofervidicoccus sp. A16 TaxID=2607662 RepID=UPI00118C4B6D|nr:hypothetical protein [Methanofervidicoccus sp. A16]AXI25717.1 hypothetical protein CFE53_06125 [Methanofervidicoccus sp. A16]MBW9219908.1 hypothetical protein [Methanothermococcus sp. SCGC AD-155-N22]MBW9220473.1 hypothetical protein [Methanothermococcus sp. SCGC AD-155-N22]
MGTSDPLLSRMHRHLQKIRGDIMESKNLSNDLKSDENVDTVDSNLDEEELIKKSENLKKIVENLQNRIKKAVIGLQLEDERKESTEEEKKEEPEKEETKINQREYLEEISKKLEELPKAIGEMGNPKIEEMLNQILEKINVLIDKNTENAKKLDRIIEELDKIISKLEDISEKMVKLYESGGITVLDVINLIREIHSGICEIKEILSTYRYEEIDRAIEIADNLNNKMDTYLKEFEKIVNESVSVA